jgi:hypothetical protein
MIGEKDKEKIGKRQKIGEKTERRGRIGNVICSFCNAVCH